MDGEGKASLLTNKHTSLLLSAATLQNLYPPRGMLNNPVQIT